MEEALDTLLEKARKEFGSIADRAGFESAKARYSGPRGELTGIMRGMAQVPKEEKPRIGRKVNEVKNALEALYEATLLELEEQEEAQRRGPPLDPTLPSPDGGPGTYHPITLIREEMCSLLRKVGFTVAEGPEVESEYFCFDALNMAPDHPARDVQDTYYFPENARFSGIPKRGKERYLLRTHTSSVQIRSMQKTEPPLRIVSPGRCFRRDTADATHSANFHQIEGLYVDRDVTVRDLKAILDYISKSLLGTDAKTRFRPNFFPYTEPSFEVDFYSSHLAKVGREWTEIGGCGMVHPNVLEEVGYDPGVYSGYAFGMGLERIAMILYGVDDIRYFYQNDHRFLKQFI